MKILKNLFFLSLLAFVSCAFLSCNFLPAANSDDPEESQGTASGSKNLVVSYRHVDNYGYSTYTEVIYYTYRFFDDKSFEKVCNAFITRNDGIDVKINFGAFQTGTYSGDVTGSGNISLTTKKLGIYELAAAEKDALNQDESKVLDYTCSLQDHSSELTVKIINDRFDEGGDVIYYKLDSE